MIKVGADDLGENKGVSTLEKYFFRSEVLVNMQKSIQFWRRNLRFCIFNKFPVNADTDFEKQGIGSSNKTKSSFEFENERK